MTEQSKETILSYFLITGKIDQTETPQVVIDEIISLTGCKKFEDFFQLKFVTVKEFLNENDGKYIETFINPTVKWDRKSLSLAWNFTKFMMKPEIQVKFDPSIIGLQTPEFPYSLNNCMLYKICKQWGIPIEKTTTTNDMVTYIKFSIYISSNYFHDSNVKEKLKNIRNFILSKIGNDVFDLSDMPTKISLYTETMKKLSFTRKYHFGTIYPSNNIEAISRMAMDYKLDISFSKCPIVDYYYYISYADFADEKLRLVRKISPDQMDLNFNFNPIFPHSVYDRKKMRLLLKNKGYTGIINTNDIFSTLETDYLTDNFGIGWKLKKKGGENCTVVEKYNVDIQNEDIDLKKLIYYGNGESGYSFFTYSELTMLYQNYKCFVVPDNISEVLQENCIQRLIMISRENPELSQVVSSISIRNIKSSKNLDILLMWFETLTNQNKENVCEILNTLLHAGMYMRGWKGGEDSFPYKKRIQGDEKETEELENNIYLHLHKLTDYYQTDIGKKILDLDLYLFSYNNWKKSEDKVEGFTIKERLDMVGRGETQRKITSCYKMSSNWICSSAYKYMIIFGMKEPFNIYMMKQVSE